MKIAIASGKGGTGKTTVALNLALSIQEPVRLLDCDVDEPNCHLFLKPRIHEKIPVTMPMPKVDEEKCTACGECSRICQFHAIVLLHKTPLVFPELCHGCGGCLKVCPSGAIVEIPKEIGWIEIGTRDSLQFIQGRLNIGQPMSPPLIRKIKAQPDNSEKITILDCPPGTSCPMISAVRECDYVVLVTEPTPFGLYDFKLAVEVMRLMQLPFGAIINRADCGDSSVQQYCEQEQIPILLRIPDDRRIAEAYSEGKTVVEALPEYAPLFNRLYQIIRDAVVPRSPERISG